MPTPATTTTTTMSFSMPRLRYVVSLSNSIPHFVPMPTHGLYSQPPSTHTPVDDVVSSFNRMLRMRLSPPIIQSGKILGDLVKMQHYRTAISLSQKMEFRGIESDIVNFNILINCFGHLGQMNFAFSVLVKILKKGFQPNTITFNTLMKGLCLNGEVKKALHFHDDIMAKGFQLDHITYGTLINGLCKMGETKAVLQMLRQIEEEQLVRLNVVMYNTIIDSTCKDKLVRNGCDLCSEMIVKKISPSVVTYNTLIRS